jgi:catechol 2,3-dioxygenase-like lactoylglutathione lyase family enzyme
MQLQGLDHVAISVSDLPRSIAWYQDVLGLQRHFGDVWGDEPAFLMAGQSGLALFRSKSGTNQQPSALSVRHIAFRVDRRQFGRAQEELKARGIAFEFQDHDVSHSIYFNDPDGHQLEITTYEIAEGR